jgi:hypothetical protein
MIETVIERIAAMASSVGSMELRNVPAKHAEYLILGYQKQR